MAMTPEQLTLVVAAAVQQALAAQAASVGGGGDRGGDHGGSGRVCEKNFRRMDKFDGGEESWKAWEFDFKVATSASAAEVAKAMVVAETAIQAGLRGGEPCEVHGDNEAGALVVRSTLHADHW